MATFQFRLATLLRLREATRDQRRSELAQAYQALETLGKQQEQFAQEIEAARGQCRRAAQRGAVNVDRLVAAQRYETTLEAQRKLLTEQARLVEEEIERRREALIEADRAVRALEKLREKKEQEFKQQQHRREIKAMDEIAARIRFEEYKS